MTQPSSERPAKAQVALIDVIPDRWFKSRPNSSFWLTGFRIPLMDQSAFQSGASRVDLLDSIALLTFGEVSYFDAGTLSREEDGQGAVRLNAVVGGMRQAGPSAWLLLMTPFEVDGLTGNEPETKQRISTAAAMVAVFCGRNAVFERVFDNVVSAAGTSTVGYSPAIENPGVFPRPDLNPNRLELLAHAASALSTKTEPERNRVLLSLHWYESALRSKGVDAFLKGWIALEVLAMPDGTDIRPINEALARAYSQTLAEAVAVFHVGRLFGMRSRIVHEGELLRIHYLIEGYLQAVYADVLCDHLGIPTQADAETMLETRRAELLPLLMG